MFMDMNALDTAGSMDASSPPRSSSSNFTPAPVLLKKSLRAPRASRSRLDSHSSFVQVISPYSLQSGTSRKTRSDAADSSSFRGNTPITPSRTLSPPGAARTPAHNQLIAHLSKNLRIVRTVTIAARSLGYP